MVMKSYYYSDWITQSQRYSFFALLSVALKNCELHRYRTYLSIQGLNLKHYMAVTAIGADSVYLNGGVIDKIASNEMQHFNPLRNAVIRLGKMK
jgi:hypothetical protein